MPSSETAIEWTDSTWNPVHGCAKVSEGCQNCYAARISTRYGHTDHDWTAANVDENVREQLHHLDWPTSLETPQRVFVNSMSDLFLPREYVSDEYLHRIFDVIDDHPEHAFIALTKHGAETDGIHGDEPRLLKWDSEHGRWPENLWMGVSVESPDRTYRIDTLLATGAVTKWVSFEPLVEEIVRVDLEEIDWAVVGGESGPEDDRREMDHMWARAIRNECALSQVPFYFKQSSGPKQGHEPILAERGSTPAEARLQGGLEATTEYKQLPRLPDALREARPDLAAWELETPGQEVQHA